MKKLLASLILSVFLIVPGAFAATTLLPGETEQVQEATIDECLEAIEELEEHIGDEDKMQEYLDGNDGGVEFIQEVVLGCAIKTGKIKAWMLPYFVARALNFIIGISGLISVLMIIVGAFYYIAGGLNEDKEKGKTIITYSLGGFVLVLLSWAIVNALLLLLTT